MCNCRSLSDFRLQRKVGQGQNSTVYHAVHCSSKTVVALKVYAKCTLTAVTRKQVQREIEIQGRLDHEHIAKLVRHLCAGVMLHRFFDSFISSWTELQPLHASTERY